MMNEERITKKVIEYCRNNQLEKENHLQKKMHDRAKRLRMRLASATYKTKQFGNFETRGYGHSQIRQDNIPRNNIFLPKHRTGSGTSISISPDMAPYEFVFSELKISLKGKRFNNVKIILKNVDLNDLLNQK